MMLETQTQIGVGLPLTSVELLEQAMQMPTGVLHVCLCDDTLHGHSLQYGWTHCDKHDAAKLASMKGMGVLLHVKNKTGEIVPLRLPPRYETVVEMDGEAC